jgi:hypothetical protein
LALVGLIDQLEGDQVISLREISPVLPRKTRLLLVPFRQPPTAGVESHQDGCTLALGSSGLSSLWRMDNNKMRRTPAKTVHSTHCSLRRPLFVGLSEDSEMQISKFGGRVPIDLIFMDFKRPEGRKRGFDEELAKSGPRNQPYGDYRRAWFNLTGEVVSADVA